MSVCQCVWFRHDIQAGLRPDFDDTDISLRLGAGTLKLTLCTEAGIMVFDMGAVQNISIAFGRYTVRKSIQEQLITMTSKLELILFQLDVQFQRLLSDVIDLKTGVLRPTLVTFQEMLQFKAILKGQVIDKQFQLPSDSQIFKTASLYTRPVLIGNVLILTLRVPLLCRSKSFLLFKSKTFPMPLHGHLSQLVGLPTYLIVSTSYIGFPNADDARKCEYMSNQNTGQLDLATQPLQSIDCPTTLILNSISGVKTYCQFNLIIQSVPSLPHIDYLLHVHYLLTNIPSLSLICKNSSRSNVRVIKGCFSCLYNCPCHCTIRTANFILYTGFHGCAYKNSSKGQFRLFPTFQHVSC